MPNGRAGGARRNAALALLRSSARRRGRIRDAGGAHRLAAGGDRRATLRHLAERARGYAAVRGARAPLRNVRRARRRIAARDDRRNVRARAAISKRAGDGARRYDRTCRRRGTRVRVGRERAPKTFQRVGAQRVRRVSAKVVLPLCVRRHRGSGVVGGCIRNGLPSRARRFSRGVSASARERRNGDATPRRRVRAVGFRAHARGVRDGRRVRTPTAACVANGTALRRLAARAGAGSALRSHRSRSGRRPRPRRIPVRRLHRPARPRRALGWNGRRRLQDREHRTERGRVSREDPALSRFPTSILLLGTYCGGRQGYAARPSAAQGRAARRTPDRARSRPRTRDADARDGRSCRYDLGRRAGARTRAHDRIGAELSSGALRKFAVAADPAACEYCAYATACAHRPPPAPERFAR